MMKLINNLSIRLKFLILYVLGVLLPIAILLVYVLTNVTTSIRERELQNAQQSLDRVYSTLDTQFSSAVALSNALSVDNYLLKLVRREYDLPWRYYNSYYTEIRPVMMRYLSAFAQPVSAIELYSDNKTLFSGGYCLSLSGAKDEPWMTDDLTVPSVRLVSYIKRNPTNTGSMQISLIRTVVDETHSPIVLKIDVYTEAVYRAIVSERDYLGIYLVSPDGYAVCYPGSMQEATQALINARPPDNAGLTASFTSNHMVGWRLEATINEAPIQKSVRGAIWVGLLVGVLCSVLAGALCMVMSRSIESRSNHLLRHMDSMTNEHFAPIRNDTGRDEIGELIKHFNAMSDRMQQLIHDIYELELHNKNYELESVRAELKYLQAQIDPHFLFNTLNAILVLCVRNGYTELADVIRALSKILRRMIDTTREAVPLREELEFVKMALLIERFRFGDKLRYEIDVPDEMMDAPVPVMSVQALVENACKHGIQHIDRQGVILIRAHLDADCYCIDVIDNGAGIAPQRMAFLQQTVHSSDDIEGSIGLQNIYRRLVLQYGEKAELRLNNATGSGLIASIRIPRGEDTP